MKTLKVVWEDERSLTKTFGPHSLCVRCVADVRADITFWALERQVVGLPLKGIDKIRTFLSDPRAARDVPLVVVPDADVIREKLRAWNGTLKPSNDATDAEVHEHLRRLHPTAVFVLLKDNVEDVVAHACSALGEPVPPLKLSPSERDAVLGRLTSAPRSVRDDFLKRMPSFAEVIRAVLQLLKD